MKKSQVNEVEYAEPTAQVKCVPKVKSAIENYYAAVKEYEDHKKEIEKQKSDIERMISFACSEDKYALNAALEASRKKIGLLESSIIAERMAVSDCKIYCWQCVYNDLISQIPDGLMTKIINAGLMAGRPEFMMTQDLLNYQADGDVLSQLACEYGVPA